MDEILGFHEARSCLKYLANNNASSLTKVSSSWLSPFMILGTFDTPRGKKVLRFYPIEYLLRSALQGVKNVFDFTPLSSLY